MNFVIEELKDPHKNLPIAIFTSCILVTVVYTLTIIAFHSTLSVAQVLSAEAVAVVSDHFSAFFEVFELFIVYQVLGECLSSDASGNRKKEQKSNTD